MMKKSCWITLAEIFQKKLQTCKNLKASYPLRHSIQRSFQVPFIIRTCCKRIYITLLMYLLNPVVLGKLHYLLEKKCNTLYTVFTILIIA